MTETEKMRKRAADAATAVERLAQGLAHQGTEDPVTVAYILRLLEATARVDDYTEHDRRRVAPDPNYLRTLRADPGYSANH